MIITLIHFLIWLLILGLCFWLAIWVLGMFGITVPPQIIRIVGAIVFLVVLLWFLQVVLSGGGHFPRLM